MSVFRSCLWWWKFAFKRASSVNADPIRGAWLLSSCGAMSPVLADGDAHREPGVAALRAGGSRDWVSVQHLAGAQCLGPGGCGPSVPGGFFVCGVRGCFGPGLVFVGGRARFRGGTGPRPKGALKPTRTERPRSRLGLSEGAKQTERDSWRWKEQQLAGRKKEKSRHTQAAQTRMTRFVR